MDLVTQVLPGAPIITAQSAAGLLDRSFKAASDPIARLVEADIPRQVNVGRRNRQFEAPEVIEAFTALEWQVASPRGDTMVSGPARRVPRRPNTG